MRWPSLFNGVDSSTEEWIVDQMHIVIYSADPLKFSFKFAQLKFFYYF